MVGLFKIVSKNTESAYKFKQCLTVFCGIKNISKVFFRINFELIVRVIFSFRCTHLAVCCKLISLTCDHLACKDSCCLRCGISNNIVFNALTIVGLRELNAVLVHCACCQDVLKACRNVLGCVCAVVTSGSDNSDPLCNSISYKILESFILA